MKIAQHLGTRQPVAAMADAPVQALCPPPVRCINTAQQNELRETYETSYLSARLCLHNSKKK
jgi:hypothetical protein